MFMVYNTNDMWLNWGWFTIVLLTLCHCHIDQSEKNLHELDTKLMACLIAWILKLLMSWITNDTCNLWWSIARTIVIESSLDQMNRRDTPKLNGLLSLLGLLKSCDKPHNKNRRAHRAFDHHVSGGLKKQIHSFFRRSATSTNAGTSSTILKW